MAKRLRSDARGPQEAAIEWAERFSWETTAAELMADGLVLAEAGSIPRDDRALAVEAR